MKAEKLAWIAVGFLTSKYMYIPAKKAVVITIIIAAFLLGFAAGHYDIQILINQLK